MADKKEKAADAVEPKAEAKKAPAKKTAKPAAKKETKTSEETPVVEEVKAEAAPVKS